MNKLRKKIFWTLLIIISAFLVSILFIFNYQNYNREKMNISENLFRMNNIFNKDHPNRNTPKFDNDEIPLIDDIPRRFMGATVYTVLLDGSGIARSLSYNPKIIIADEPTGNLDKDTEDEILKIFKDLAHKENKCVIIVTISKNVCDNADVVYELKKVKK